MARYKKLVGDKMKGFKRVHIDKHFVLEVDNTINKVQFLDYDHRKNI